MSRSLTIKKTSTPFVTFCIIVLAVLVGVSQLWSKRSQSVQILSGDNFNANIDHDHSQTGGGIETAQATIEITLREDRQAEFAVFRDIKVSWRRAVMPSGVRPPYGPKYEILRSKALNGDADSAFALYNILDECKNAFASENEATAAIDNFRETHLLQLPGWDKPLRMRTAENIEVMVGQIDSSFANCYPIASEQKAEKHRWLEVAADGGSLLAEIWYANLATDSEKSMDAALAAWNRGAAQALLVMQKRYTESYKSGDDVRGNINAFASLYAYTYLLSDSRDWMSSPRVEEARKSLESARTLLKEHEINEAIKKALNDVKSNSNCCIRL